MFPVLLLAASAHAAVVFTDSFDRPDSAVPGNGWTEITTGGGDAAIVNNQLQLVNGSPAGAAYVYREVSSFGAGFSPQLSQSAGSVQWTFNMHSGRDDLSGFASSSYGIGFILGTTSSDFLEGSGYAVVWGQSGTDPLRLVRYTAGLKTGSEITDLIVGAGGVFDDMGTDHLSVRVTYDPADDTWALAARNDGSSFANPAAGDLTVLGAATDATYVEETLNYMGAFWKYNTTAGQSVDFDSISVEVVPEPGFYGMAAVLFLGTMALLRAVPRYRARHRL